VIKKKTIAWIVDDYISFTIGRIAVYLFECKRKEVGEVGPNTVDDSWIICN
jgi:hypothetical protein